MSKLDSRFLPDNVLARMDKGDRPKGAAGKTHAELRAKKEANLERDEQRLFARLLEQRFERGELIYDWSATHKPTTNKTGRADFWIASNNRFCQIEFKAAKGKLSSAQQDMKTHSLSAGVDYHVVFSADEANTLLRKWLGNI